MDTLIITKNLKTFFECEDISQVNRDIVLDYMDSLFDDPRQLSEITIKLNANIIKFVLTHIKTDLNELTVKDITYFKRVIREWRRFDGKEIAQSTKSQYFLGLKRFLRWYEETVDDTCGYIKLSKQIKVQMPKSNKLPSDLLTQEEIEKMIMAADGTRNKAIIATLADSGCRIGEIVSCRVKDVERLSDGCRLTFPKGKTGSRTVLIQYAAYYINQWLEVHPQPNNPNAPLWSTNMKQNIGTKEDKKYEYNAMAYDTIYGMIKKTAKKAGITKRVHPHLFRHTAATRISKKMSESEMKMFLGWGKDSYMPSVYIHLSNEDLDNAVRAMNGTITIEKKDENGLKVIKCIRCKNIVPSGSIYCKVCGLPLTEEAQYKITSKKEEMLSILSQHQDVFMEIMAEFRK